MANTPNLDLKKMEGDPKSTNFNHKEYYENNFEKVDAAVGVKPTDLTTTAKTIIPAINEVNAQLADIEQNKAEKTDIGLLSALLTTAKTSIVNAINELFNNKANKAQEAWITPTLLNGATFDTIDPIRYRKNDLGRVEFKGKVVTINSGVCFEMPSGYRVGAGKTRRFPIIRDNSTVSLVSILNNQVYPVIGALDFSGVSYVAEA